CLLDHAIVPPAETGTPCQLSRRSGLHHLTTGGTGPPIQKLIGAISPHSKHLVAEYSTPQLGQKPSVSKMSNGFRHLLHVQNDPRGGGAWQAGHANPSRRGAFAMRSRASPSSRPFPQLMKMNAHISAYQGERSAKVRTTNPINPTNPMTVAITRLRACPNGNQSSARRIWPPSSG